MNWISNYVRPRINSIFSRRETPDNLWTKCKECGTMLFHREVSDNLNVCTSCGHHMAITPRDRFISLFDGGIFVEIDVPTPIDDPLTFRDQKKYPDRMKAAQKGTGEKDAMLVAAGEIGRTPIVAAGQDFSFMGGSMGMYVGNAIIAAAEAAVKAKCPLILFSAAGGARMQEGILSLMQMPRSTIAIQMLKEAGLPYIVVLTHPTTGGVTASYAMLGDVHIAEPNALICFAGPRVIEQTIREKLPEGFQRAEYLLDHGMLDRVTPRTEMRGELITIVRMLMGMSPEIKGDLPAPEPETADAKKMSGTTSDAILARMMALHPKIIDLTLDRVWRLLEALGNPQDDLPPVIHIAGTNGKGSTQAMIRAGLEGAGQRVHAYTSPHLARFHERIRVAGLLITEDALTDILDECYVANNDETITYFEITTCAAILAFARTPADYTLLEVGLGGRVDATNVFAKPALTIITPVSFDHPQFLGNTVAEIAGEKAGILKRGVPAIITRQPDDAMEVIEARAERLGAPMLVQGQHWDAWEERGRLIYQDETGLLDLPPPALMGAHQFQNAGTAITALRHFGFGADACKAVPTNVTWAARMQKLSHGPLIDAAPDAEFWLDGGHNAACAGTLAETLTRLPKRPTHLICGMLNTKDISGYLEPLVPHTASLTAISIPDEVNTLPAPVTAQAATDVGMDADEADSVMSAVQAILENQSDARILICGSLYLAGAILRENG